MAAPFSAAAILRTGYPGFPGTNPFLPMIRKFTLKSRNLARSMGAAGKGAVSNGNLVRLLTAGMTRANYKGGEFRRQDLSSSIK